MISVAISVFNLKRYIEPCVENILDQTYKDVEIILVDDCSSDGSFETCRRLSELHPNVKTFRTSKNLGQSGALSLALEHFSGDWLVFLDVDDTLPKDALERMVKAGVDNHAEIVFADYATTDEDGKICDRFSLDIPSKMYTGQEFAELLFTAIGLNAVSCIGSKIYSSSFLKKKKIKTEKAIGNFDLAFSIDAIRCSDAIFYLNYVSYLYLQRSGSVQHSYKKDLLDQHILVRKKVRQFLTDKGCFCEKKHFYYSVIFDAIKESLKQEFMLPNPKRGFYNAFQRVLCNEEAEEAVLFIAKSGKNHMDRALAKRMFKKQLARLYVLFFFNHIKRRLIR